MPETARQRKRRAWKSRQLNLPGVKVEERRLSPHKSKHPKRKVRLPGPASYSANVDAVKPRARGTSFGGRMAKVDRGKTGAWEAVHRRAKEPGPGAYDQRRRPRTTSTAVFGSSARDDTDKRYMPGVDLTTSRWAPGPGAYRPKYNAARKGGGGRAFSFGGQGLSRSLEDKYANPNVSPFNYQSPGALGALGGKQAVSKRRSAPTATFGRGTRRQRAVVCAPDVFQPTSLNQTPAPGTYEAPGGTGKQVLSKCRSENGGTFLRTGRESAAKEQERAARRRTRVPDPGVYPVQQAVGTQFVSTAKTAPGYKFGTAARQPLG